MYHENNGYTYLEKYLVIWVLEKLMQNPFNNADYFRFL